jgi:hypothetical protein
MPVAFRVMRRRPPIRVDGSNTLWADCEQLPPKRGAATGLRALSTHLAPC